MTRIPCAPYRWTSRWRSHRRIASFELGSGMYITIVVPEKSAAFMRDIVARMRPERP
jgi:hypothetical protein